MDVSAASSEEIPAPSGKSSTANSGSIKETIESILVAFILAFIFRAFVVEAFVIPTGSMAPTLMGAHVRMHCPDCAYNFDVNISAPPGKDDGSIPPYAGNITTPLFCPNCGFQVDPSQTNNPPVYFGDRILVLKYQYLLNPPRRWDVVVFKAPVAPETYNYSVNYIKRLVGKPGESLMIVDGDVYVRAADAKDPNDFKVQTKPKYAQDALWRLVYDNDYHPQQKLDRDMVKPFVQPWMVAEGSGWKLDDPMWHGRVFEFDNAAGSSTINFSPNANATAQTMSDYLVYDALGASLPVRRPSDPFPNGHDFPVSDLDLRLTYERVSGDGPLSLSLTKRDHRFTAVLTPTEAKLFQTVGNHQKQIGETVPFGNGVRSHRIELSNVDYQVTLRIDEKAVIRSTPADYAPDLSQLLTEFENNEPGPAGTVGISADRQVCRVSHVGLYRDVFYYNGTPVYDVRRATPRNFPHNAVTIGKDEYFVLGDNSAVSFDARCWKEPIDLPDEALQCQAGRVPGRLLLGKAFFVYWPAGFEPVSGFPALIPNFGDMRFIH